MASAAPVHVRREPVGKPELNTEPAQQAGRLLVVDGDELGARLGVPAVVERIAQGEDAPTDAVACFETRHLEAELLQPPRTREPRQSCADDDHVPASRLQRERCSRGGAEELAPGEHYGRRSYADSVRNSTKSSASATSSKTSRAVS